MLLNSIIHNSVQGVMAVVGWVPSADQPVLDDESKAESLLTAPLYPKDGIMSGNNAVFFAAYLNKREILAYFAELCCFHERLVRPVITQMFAFQRYSMVFHLATLAPNTLTDSFGEARDTLLHLACRRHKPPTEFVQDLLKTVAKETSVGPYVNIQNAAGETALHLVAYRSTGKEGGAVAKALLLAGAREETQNNQGKTARQVATNPYVRDLMSLGRGPKPRPLPEIDEQSRIEIDKCKDSDSFPAIKPVEVPPTDPQLLLPVSPAFREDAIAASPDKKKKKKKLSEEQKEAMLQRLAVQSVEQKKRWLESKMSVLEELDKSRSKQLSAEECAAATQRLHDNELATRDEKKAAIVDKYLKPLPEGPKLEPEDLEASAVRLGGAAAVGHKKKVHDSLMEKYSPPRQGKRITKSQLEASAARLHDESAGHAKETHAKLFETYCPSPEKKKLSKNDQQEMANRLSRKA